MPRCAASIHTILPKPVKPSTSIAVAFLPTAGSFAAYRGGNPLGKAGLPKADKD
jgi:hypothetical protein